MEIGLSIFVTFILIVVNGYFSMAEMALVNAKQIVLSHEAEEGDAKASVALSVAQDSDDMLATIQVGITLASFFTSAAAATTLSDPFAAWIQSFGIGWLSSISSGLATVLITLVVSYITIVAGELVPKRIALANAERVSKQVAGSLRAFSKVASPLVTATSAASQGAAHLLHIRTADDRQHVTEEEIKDLVTDNQELEPDEKRMIHEIIELGDADVHEIMVPRTDMVMVSGETTVRETVERMRATGYSRVPVYEGNHDTIIGVAHFKEIVSVTFDGKGDDQVKRYISSAMFVPESQDIYKTLSKMQTKRQQLAVVVDEYGGTDGLITLEDIVEEIVGEIYDESDRNTSEVVELSDTSWIADGSLPCKDACELGWPVQESEEYDTIAGWLIFELGDMPAIGDRIECENFRFEIQAMRRQRISKVRVTKEEVPEDSPSDDGEQHDDTVGEEPQDA